MKQRLYSSNVFSVSERRFVLPSQKRGDPVGLFCDPLSCPLAALWAALEPLASERWPGALGLDALQLNARGFTDRPRQTGPLQKPDGHTQTGQERRPGCPCPAGHALLPARIAVCCSQSPLNHALLCLPSRKDLLGYTPLDQPHCSPASSPRQSPASLALPAKPPDARPAPPHPAALPNTDRDAPQRFPPVQSQVGQLPENVIAETRTISISISLKTRFFIIRR